jgi:hypothetical protein
VKLTVVRVVAALTLSLFVTSPVAETQQAGKVPRIGFLSWGFPPPSDRWGEPFRE